MIDEVRGPGDGNRIRSPRGSSPRPEPAPSAPAAEFRNRLRGVTGDLEELLARLSRIEGTEREALERQISSARVALQNVLSVDSEEPGLPSGLPAPGGLSLDRRNVLRLLDRS